jgi:hypothetical protein
MGRRFAGASGEFDSPHAGAVDQTDHRVVNVSRPGDMIYALTGASTFTAPL